MVGRQGNYWWLQGKEFRVRDIFRSVPDIVVGQYVAITSSDSSTPVLQPADQEAGWTLLDEIAYSPRIGSLDEISTEDWDELYLSGEPIRLDQAEVFVNLGGFSLEDPEHILAALQPTWDRRAAMEDVGREKSIQGRFWRQLERSDADTYLGTGDNFICVTRKKDLWEKIVEFSEALNLGQG